MGRLAEAERSLRSALKLDPASVSTRMNLALSNKLVDLLLGLPPRDWDGHLLALVRQAEEAARSAARRREQMRDPNAPPALPLAALAGEYEDPAYGRAKATQLAEEARRRFHASVQRTVEEDGSVTIRVRFIDTQHFDDPKNPPIIRL